MIRVTLYLRQGMLTGFEVRGHAGYAQEGYDIICSGVSALTLTAANSLETLTDDALSVDAGEDGGYLRVIAGDERTLPSEKAVLLLESLRLGLLSIQETYGDSFLKIREDSL